MTQSLRPMTAPTLALELRETIARWFSARDTMPNSQLILAVLADLAAEQIAANPTHETADAALKQFHREFLRSYATAVRLSLGGAAAIIVLKQ
jgi:thymidylate kinase